MLKQPTDCRTDDKKHLKTMIVIDGVMTVILLVNLAWMVYDWAFSFPPFHEFIRENLTRLYRFYEPIHVKYWSYDLVFAAIFLLEFFLRWGLSVHWKEYHRGFFYPALHIYDFLGSLPGGFRWLRLFRIIAFFSRLQKLVRLDHYLFRKYYKYRDVLMEEISDRVVINVLTDMQREIQAGTPLLKRIVQEVIRPKRQVITELLVEKLRLVARDMNDIFEKDLRLYIEGCIRKALSNSEDIRLLEKIPGAGRLISRRVENMAADIAFHSVDKVFKDLHLPENDRILHELAGKLVDGILAEAKGDISGNMAEIIHHTLEIVKEKVAEQQWKIKELREAAVCMEPDEGRG